VNTAAAHVQEQFDDAEQQRSAATLGMWTFLATEILLFGALFCAYAACRNAYPQGFAAAARHTDALLGTIETAVLLTSSLSMALAIRALRLAQRRVAVALIAATVMLGRAFLGIHASESFIEWHEHLFPGRGFDAQLGSRPGAQLFFVMYYVLTGLHALHVTIGAGVLAVLGVIVARGRLGPDYVTPLELGGLYWHLVDIVWIFLYPLFYLMGRS
jgi:cytochrome c oxidase subunit 3